MDMQIGAKAHGFTLTAIRDIPGSPDQLVQMVYDKTGTELVWYSSREANKLFSVAFKTLPEDSTGVFHILEHSVLCGSAKYPVKEPFVELMKSSMNTFLNAITFPDKTMYPVSSRNEQDYLNLAEVYLDAVFAPRAMEDEKIFLQEGWRHEIDGENLSYNGVVFNEMKGAMSSVDQLAYDGMQRLLFPDNCYGFNSGGDPACIPDLTYRQYCDSYHACYHPSNAFIYLDGSVPLGKTLALLDTYLSGFEMGEKQQLTLQTPRVLEAAIPCEAVPGEDISAKGQVLLGRILGTWADKQRNLAAKVLFDVLCGSNDAPLKRAILGAGLGQDVSLELDDGIAQSWMSLWVRNTDPDNAQAIRDLVRSTVVELAEKGLDKEALTASINLMEYSVKDLREPKALWRGLNLFGSWLYGGDPMQNLHYEDVFPALRQMVEDGGFETLMTELLDDAQLSLLRIIPAEDQGRKTREAESARLAREREAMDEARLDALAARNDVLHAWQQTPDSPEALETLPVLSLDQISREPERTPLEVTEAAGIPLLLHRIPTNGIVHLAAYFDLTELALEELPAAAFLCQLLGQLPTGSRSAAQLQNQCKSYMGSLSFRLDVTGKKGRSDTCTPRIVLRASVLEENLPIALELIGDILTGTRLDEKDRILEILHQSRMAMEQKAIGGGHTFAGLCAQAHFSARFAALEAANAWTYSSWLREFRDDFDNKLPGFLTDSQKILSAVFCRARLTLSVTADRESDLLPLVELLPQGTPAPAEAAYRTCLPEKMGIRIPAQASFACIGYHLDRVPAQYQGSLRLAANVLDLSCLWNAVRVQGGAYGAGMRCGRGGSMFCYSYRDPSPARTLGVYRELGAFLKAFPDSGESLDKFIISSVAATEPLMPPAALGDAADMDWFMGNTYQDDCQERRELLEAKPHDLLHWCDTLKRMAAEAAVCVVGHQEALEACAEENLTIVDL